MKNFVPDDVRRLLPHACACLALVSCQTTSPPAVQSGKVPYQAGHWTMVASKPPTYFPRGVPAGAPTNWQDGEWFRICDAAGTRYFIPFKIPAGSNRGRLVSEVCSLRTDDYQRLTAAEDAAVAKDQAKRLAKHSTVLVPLNTVLFFRRNAGRLSSVRLRR
jgi:hypothetical protein